MATHASKSDRIPAMIDLALAYGLAGYDPQHGTAITRTVLPSIAMIRRWLPHLQHRHAQDHDPRLEY